MLQEVGVMEVWHIVILDIWLVRGGFYLWLKVNIVSLFGTRVLAGEVPELDRDGGEQQGSEKTGTPSSGLIQVSCFSPTAKSNSLTLQKNGPLRCYQSWNTSAELSRKVYSPWLPSWPPPTEVNKTISFRAELCNINIRYQNLTEGSVKLVLWCTLCHQKRILVLIVINCTVLTKPDL